MTDSPEEQLAGGNVTPVVRIGDTVHRAAGPWTPAVHTLLGVWADAGIAETPRALGVDDQGREVVTYVEGVVLVASDRRILWSMAILEQAARLLRRLHDASTDLVAEDLTWRMAAHPPNEVICHNDVAPYNLLQRDGVLVGIIDTDMASPGSRLWDLAYLIYRLAPYAEDAAGFDPVAFGAPEQRMRALLDAYGMSRTNAEVRGMMIERLEALIAFTEEQAAMTGRPDLGEHAAMYRRDVLRLHAE